MPDKQPASAYNSELIARVKRLREGMRRPDGSRWTSEDMAKALGCGVDAYRKYESRTPIPHELIERFALICGVTVEYVVTGNKPVDIRTMRYKKRAVIAPNGPPDGSKAAEKSA